jgi:asparagine synthase (glutamine-hydrolysing)
MLHLDTRVWLPDDLLVKADKMTMAHGVELRVPLLDHELVEFAWALPDRMKIAGSTGKHLFRRAMRGQIPDFTIDRPKQGFATPTAAWLRSGLYELLHDTLRDPRSFASRHFDRRVVDDLIARHKSGRADHAAELWPLLVLELWHAEVVGAARPSAPKLVEESIYAAS